MKRLIAALLLWPLASAAASPGLDSIAERTAACLLCHGTTDRAAGTAYFPRIAGKPQGYLYQQLLHFREGRRINPAMNHLVANLSDAYLMEIAGHFAAQRPPYPSAPPVRASQRELALGRRLVYDGDPVRKLPACVACHGQQLSGVAPAIPGLFGLPRAYLAGQFGAWRNGVRRATAPDCMAQIAARLTPGEVGAVASWLAAQPVPSDYAPAPQADARSRPHSPLACGSVP